MAMTEPAATAHLNPPLQAVRISRELAYAGEKSCGLVAIAIVFTLLPINACSSPEFVPNLLLSYQRVALISLFGVFFLHNKILKWISLIIYIVAGILISVRS